MNASVIVSESLSSPTNSSVWLTGLLSLAVLLIVHFYHELSHKAKLGNEIPGPISLPFIGNAYLVIGVKSNHHVFSKAMEMSQKFGKVVRLWLGWKLAVFLMDPRDVEIILNSTEHIDKSDEYRLFEPWFGNGLLISTGDKWRTHRKLIAPAFHMNILKSFVSIFNENSKKVVQRLTQEAGKEIDIHEYMSETTVDILLETAMGFRKTTEENVKSGFDYAMAVMRMCDVIHQRHYRPTLHFDWIFNFSKFKKIHDDSLNIIHTMTRKVLDKKKAIFDQNLKKGKLPKPSMQEIIENKEPTTKKQDIRKVTGLRDDLDDIDENDIGEKRRLAFLDLMIETSHFNPSQISDEEIKNQVDTIMFEGHDTTAAGSSFVLCMLGIHSEIEKKVMQEQRAIFGDSLREATFADTIEMKYLERVIMETLRLYPPVPIIARRVNVDVKLASQNYTIPAGTSVAIATLKIHRDPDTYPHPEKFDPDNFLPERASNRHYYSYIPFSAGPRSCVGRKFAMLKLKVLLSTILRNFKVKSSCGEKEFQLMADIILKRADGFRLVMEPRMDFKS